jgi:predicted RecA/RadA family phage recombinase
MAKISTPRGGVKNNQTLKLAHTAAVEKYETIVSNGQVLVACGDYDADEEGIYVRSGSVEFDKEAALAIAVGDVVYWDVAAAEANKDAGEVKSGICIEAAAGADSVVLVDLGENK